MKIYVVIVASDNLIPMESGQLTIEIYVSFFLLNYLYEFWITGCHS